MYEIVLHPYYYLLEVSLEILFEGEIRVTLQEMYWAVGAKWAIRHNIVSWGARADKKRSMENKLEGCKLILFIGDLEYGTDIQSWWCLERETGSQLKAWYYENKC